MSSKLQITWRRTGRWSETRQRARFAANRATVPYLRESGGGVEGLVYKVPVLLLLALLGLLLLPFGLMFLPHRLLPLVLLLLGFSSPRTILLLSLQSLLFFL